MLKKNSTVLFQGDSITDGGRSRNDDLNHVLGHGYVYLIAAELAAKYPDRNLHFLNRGCSGNQVVNLYARWKEDTINLSPDILSILVGVNDVGAEFLDNSGIPAAQYETVYRLMLQDAQAALPDVRFVLCQPFVLPVGEVTKRWAEWRREIDMRCRVVESLASEFDAVLVRTQSVFDSASDRTGPQYWAWDGVHPMPAGHHLLAQAWITAVENQLAP